jgi:glucosamine-6-phosphate deaminase
LIKRSDEIRALLDLTPEEVIYKAGDHLIVCKDLEELHHHFAKSIFDEIYENNGKQKPTRIILPVGPTGQYPILTSMIEKEHLSLEHCWFFFMDEYCDEDGYALPTIHPLSFKMIAKMLFLIPLKEGYGLNDEQIIFPDELNIHMLSKMIREIDGIDTCYGGIGIHGHVAFNEPSIRILDSEPRKVRLNKYTITMNAIRAQIGGNLENFPTYAFTLGMKQILGAKRIRLYCRNGSPYDWANTVLRIALIGNQGDDYPVTYIRKHLDYKIITDKDTLESPKNII